MTANVSFVGRSTSPTAPTEQKKLIELNQQHTTNCIVLAIEQPMPDLTQPADAIISNRNDIALEVYTADCLPILIYHPSGIIGAVHAGRKGTLAGVLTNTLRQLKETWQIDRDVTFWFGPSICAGCYEIDRDTKTQYDLRANNRQQVEAFFDDKAFQIIENEHCTSHHNTEWYSYRREGKGVPMNYSRIWLS